MKAQKSGIRISAQRGLSLDRAMGRGSAVKMAILWMAVVSFAVFSSMAWGQATQWDFQSGSKNTLNQNGSYSSTGSAGTPGSRQGAATWTDASGNFWLFGGYGYDASSSSAVYLNDLWEYSGSQWIYISGSSVVSSGSCNAGSYGTKGTGSTSNIAGGRTGAVTWVDASGNLWLYGGFGCGASTTADYLSDLWMYTTATKQWTWAGGSSSLDVTGVYGTKGTADTSNLPGSRRAAVGWTDSSGVLWLFGGQGYDSAGSLGYINDLWKYNTSTGAWTWVSGNSTISASGNYGSKGTASSSTIPGARSGAAESKDQSGNIWLQGGYGYDGSGTLGYLQDLWKYTASTGRWTWIAGGSTANQSGSYGTEYSASSTILPGGRFGGHLWTDTSGNLWLFGGYGYDGTSGTGELNEIWQYDVTAGKWAWMGGDSSYSAAQVAQVGHPLGRDQIAGWSDSDNNFWILGGRGYLSGTTGQLNDFWEVIPATPTPSFSLAAGTYTGSQDVTVSDGLSGASIYYTTDGTTPTTASTEITAGSSVTLSSSATLKAIAVSGSHTQSLLRTVSYVVQNTPTISWTTPAAITYPTALSTTQLNPTAGYNSTTVAGSFVYTDESTGATVTTGTVLTAGSHTLLATFTPTDTTDYTTATAEVSLTVNQATPTITWATPASITYGTALSGTQLNATAAYNSTTVAGTFTYSPTAGTVLPAGTQTMTATFTPTDSTDYATVSASVSIVVTQATPTLSWTTPAAITYGTALSATQLDATSTVAGSFSYSSPVGTILTAGTHLLTATFTPTDTTDYKSGTVTVNLTVNLAAPTISWTTPSSISYGTALSSTQLNAVAYYNGTQVGGTYTYSPATGAVLAVGTHTLTVTFLPTDTTDYTSATGSVSLVVTAAAPTITWATPAAITYGTALTSTQLDASANVSGTFSYSPAAGSILTAGTQTLTVTFTPTDSDYATATATTTLTVNKATPTISWATPAAISYGTALTSTQLDAVANVAGVFVYSPSAGTVLSAGTQTLTTTFYPTDTVDYVSPITASVTITVNAADFAISASPSSQVIEGKGGSAVYVISVSSSQGTYAGAVALTVTGLPSGATATFSPSTLSPGASSVSGTLTVTLPATTSKNNNLPLRGPLGATPLLALLLGLGFRRVRGAARRYWMVLLLAVSLGAALMVTGCSGKSNLASNYTLTVTGTSGTTAHTTLVVLTVE